MRGVLGLVAIVAGCYEPPRTSCAIQCTEGAADACPSGMTCSAGYCVGVDATCTTALVSVHAGGRHACGLDATGRALCWGDGHEGQIGVANVVDAVPSPVYVGEPTDTWVSLSTGAEHTCAVKPDGTVWCWGENQSGEVRGPRGGIANVPALVMTPAGVPKFEKVYAGGAHSCALGEGQAWCWGRKDSLGLAQDPTMMMRMASPVTDFIELATGQDHTCAISASTGVWCWGNNDQSQSGQVPTSGPIAPKMVAIGLPAGKVPIHVAAGNSKTCVIMADAADAPSGDLWCWGWNQYDDLGPGGDPIAPAKQIATEPGWTAVAAGTQAICGVRDGNAYCWGTAYLGQLGDGVWSIQRPPSQPAALGPADEIAVALDSPDTARPFDELGCLRDGTQVRCWGANRFGSAGIGTMAIAMTPVAIDPPAGHTWQHVWAGDDHTCGQTDDGALWCWGANSSGGITADLGRGTANLPCTPDMPCDVVRPMAAPAAIGHPEAVVLGKSFTCALEAGAIDCWGTPDHGVLGASRSTPGLNTVTPPASQEWTKLLGGATASCGQTSGGVVSCWGRVVDADRTSPTPIASPLLADLTSLQFGDAFACGAEATGTRVCWGDNGQGQLGSGATGGNTTTPMAYAEPVAKSSSHDSHTCATTPTGGLQCWGENYNGECGQPSSSIQQVATPTPVTGAGAPLAACTQVATGAGFSCAICGDAPWCWGDATELQLGRGSQLVSGGQDELADRPAAPMSTYTEIAAGATHACALDSAGALYCWGYGPHGEIGNGSHAVNLPMLITPAR